LIVRGMFALIVCVGFVAASSAADENKDKIVGTWSVTKGEEVPPGTTIEFTKEGKLVFKLTLNGKEVKLEGTYKIEKDKLTVSMKTPDGKDDTETDTIKTLTADAMVLVDPKGKEVEFKKAVAKK
ncbi:MAG: lipocalin family protein, partial [Planctomycetes bacterium]|nr:lipocalin family protein [Planctomycetota bacterium]